MFIKTQDYETAEQLRAAGLMELNKEGSFFVFVNDEKMNFSENKKMIFTNKLNL